jgi:hypothetical protein
VKHAERRRLREAFAPKLAALLEEHDMSRNDLARELDPKGPDTIAKDLKYVRAVRTWVGGYALPEPDMLERIAEIFSVDVDELVPREEEAA